MFKKLLAFTVLIVIAASCKDDVTIDYGPIDRVIIQDYLTTKSLVAKSTASGLHYIIEKDGTTIHPTIYSKVNVKYKGYLTDGTVFDQGTIDYPLQSLIRGWQEGLPFIGASGKIKLLIPSALGYGARSQEKIPANSVLIFDIELVTFN